MRVIRSEDFEARLRAILEEAADVGRKAERDATESDHRIVARRLPNKPDFSEELVERLQEALEDEVVVAKPAQGQAVIEEREEHREIAKRALAHIRLPQLRDIAENLGLPRTGNLEDVADRIVRTFDADEEKIARLIIEYETEPPPERRIGARVFSVVRGAANLDRTVERISAFAGRYMRVGIAKWFVIDDVRSSGKSLTVDGSYRSYTADAARTTEETYRLLAQRRGADARIRLTEGRSFVEVEAKGEAESRGALDALLHAADLRQLDDLPIARVPPEGELFGWDPRSVLLLELLRTRFRSSHIEIFNLTTAGFETGEAERGEEAARPTVRSVRFQGQHLLDSRQACELLVGGQALVELTFLARFRPGPDQDVLLPVAVRLHRDHAAVSTGFGTHSPTVAAMLQKEIIRGIETSLEAGPSEISALNRLALQIRARAAQEEPVERADIFAPPE